MKGLMLKAALLGIFCAMITAFAAAQGSSYGTVRGKCKDSQGTLIVGADIVWKNQNDGRSYKLKTNKQGEFFSLGVEPGPYTVTLSKDGQVLDEQKNVHVPVDELVYDIDLKKVQEQSVTETAKKEGKSATEVKQQVQQQQVEVAKTKQYNENVKVVNEKLNAGKALMDAKNYPQAISTYQETTTLMPDKDIVWYRLGTAYADSAKTQTDPAEKTKQNTEAYNDIQKAIELNKAAPPAKDPAQAQKDKQNLAAFYDILGAVAARLGKQEEAATDYEQAAQLDPADASRYYFNEGITIYNTAGDEASRKKAVAALDKVIAADPNKADAYFLKGAILLAMSTQKSDGTLEPPAGTSESLQKYLELQPTGGYADQAKGMLSLLGQKIETSFGTTKPKKK
jgi:tetratricopeptide (TPR) repeat protein